MKIRTGGGIAEAAAKALGASPFVKPAPNPTSCSPPASPTARSSPRNRSSPFNLDKVVHYATFFPGGFYCSSFGFFMNQDKWDKLPKQDQDAIMSVSGEVLARLAGKAWDAADKVGIEAMKAAGANIVPADAGMAAEAKMSGPIIEDWIKRAGVKVPNAKAILDEFHEELKKVAAGK